MHASKRIARKTILFRKLPLAAAVALVMATPAWAQSSEAQAGKDKDARTLDTITADTQRINELLEHYIRQAPEQYLWVHRRFKTRPPGSPNLYHL